ncbi:MAG: SulP family inorganic anion transporter [Rhizobiaceae bacterium]
MSDVSEEAGLATNRPDGGSGALGTQNATAALGNSGWTDNARQAFGSFVESVKRPELLLPNLTAAVLLAIMNITTAISVAALVFSGPLIGSFGSGIGLLLWGTAFGGVLVAAGSGYKAVLAGPRSGQAPIVAGMVAGIALTMEGQPTEAIAATAIASILVSTIAIGSVLYIIGRAKLGGMVRYIPFPVMGGFFAGLGYLLFKGGLFVSLGSLVDADDLSTFASLDVVLHLAPALGFAVLFYIADSRIKHWLLMPAFLVATVALFYAVLFGSGSSISEASASGWLPNIGAGDTSFFPPFTPTQLALVDWWAILPQFSTILVMMLMSVIMVLLDTSGIEIVTDRDMDPNHELKVAGWGNVVSGFVAAPMVLQASADTAFAYKFGADRFLWILLYGALVLAAIFVGPAPISYVPTLLLGGLLMYIGIDFLMSWVWEARKKLPLTDFLVVCGILVVVATYGILEGVAVGIVLAILLFVHSYSKLSVIKTSMTGAEHVSNVDRNRAESRYLDQHGDKMHIMALQGFLFFGTASRLVEDIRKLLTDPDREPVEFLVLDFKHVVAMDTSAANSFAKLIQVCSKDGVTLVLTGCSTEIETRFRGLDRVADAKGDDGLNLFDSMDEGVAWCDDRILAGFDGSDDLDDPVRLLGSLLGDTEAAKTVSTSFERVSIGAGETLFAQGDDGDSLYLILQGSVSITLLLPGNQKLHLRTMRAGAILGEMALYTGAARSAAAEVIENCDLYRLTSDSFRDLNQKHPMEAGLLHSFIVRLMSERLARANKEIIALSR